MHISTSTYSKCTNILSFQRNPKDRKNDKIEASIGAIFGIGVGLLCMMRKQKVKSPFKLEYSLLDMCLLSALSIIGSVGLSLHGDDKETDKRKLKEGVFLSLHGDDKETDKRKLKEGVFQFSNAAIPTWLAGASLRLCETSKNFNNIPAKIVSTLGAILVGMHGAASLVNKLFDPKDLEPDRKLKLKDGIANIDDLFGIFVLAKFPLLKNIPFEKVLPFVYTYCGYKAGKTE